MSDLDQLFRDGLGDRRPAVPSDLWSKIAAGKLPVPEGENLDRLFAEGLRERQTAVPQGLWTRIQTVRHRPRYRKAYAAVALLLLLLSAGGLWFTEGAGPQVQTDPETESSLPSPIAPGEAPSRTTSIDLARAIAEDVGGSELTGERDGTAANPELALPSPGTVVTSSSISRVESLPLERTDQAAGPATLARVVPLLPTLTAEPLAPAAATFGPDGAVLDVAELLQGSLISVSSRPAPTYELLAGAAYAHQSFGLRTEADRTLRDAREVSEFPEVSYRLTARVSYPLGNRFGLMGGLTYTEIRNRLEYERIAPSGPELVRGSNRFRMLDVPLLLTYRLPGRKLRLALNAGPTINIVTGVGGKYLDPARTAPADLARDGEYRSSVGVGLTSSLTATYLIGRGRNTQLLLEPFFTAYPGSFTRAGARLSERYWLAGLQLGVRRAL